MNRCHGGIEAFQCAVCLFYVTHESHMQAHLQTFHNKTDDGPERSDDEGEPECALQEPNFLERTKGLPTVWCPGQTLTSDSSNHVFMECGICGRTMYRPRQGTIRWKPFDFPVFTRTQALKQIPAAQNLYPGMNAWNFFVRTVFLNGENGKLVRMFGSFFVCGWNHEDGLFLDLRMRSDRRPPKRPKEISALSFTEIAQVSVARVIGRDPRENVRHFDHKVCHSVCSFLAH